MKVGRVFFFLKKKEAKKTSSIGCVATPVPQGAKRSKSFFASFFSKKEDSSLVLFHE